MNVRISLPRILDRLPAALRAIPPKRAGALTAALIVTLGTACIPSSRLRPPVKEGEGWGEIHWYHAEKAPAEAGTFGYY